MKRKLLILLAVVLGSVLPVSAQQWAYRAPITVSNPSGSAVQNFQVLVSLGSGFNFAGALSDGSDLRFTSSDGATLLPFWIENWNPSGQTATIWVRVPTLPAGGTTIYLYYGNSNPAAPATINLDAPPIGPFTKAPANPIVPAGDSGNGQNLLAEDITYDPVTGHYWMVFSNYRDQTAGLVWSDTPSDPSSWHWNSSNPIVSNANSPHLINSGGTWYLFYGNWTTGVIAYSTANSVTGPYSSPTTVLSPVAAWEKSRVLECYVFQRDDGKWIMIYMGDSGNTTEQVGYATANSITGPYTKYSGNPVLSFGASGTYDAGTIADPWVLRYQTPGTSTVTYYIGYASSASNSSPWRTGYATTTDWVNFTKQGILLPLSQTGWDSTNSFRGAAIRVGSTYVLSYTGDSYEMGIATQPAVTSTPSIINNPSSVFDFFDGFSGTSLNTSTWMVSTSGNGGTATVSGNELTLDAGRGGSIQLTGNLAFGNGNIVEFRAQHLDVAHSPDAAFEAGFDGIDFGHILRMQDFPNASQLSADASYNGLDTGFTSMNKNADGNLHTYQVYRAPNGTAQFLVDGSLGVTLGPSDVPLGNLQPWLMSIADSSASQSRFVVDWVRVRKSLGNDSLATVGSQQSVGTSLVTLSSATLSPSSVTGGSTSTGTVTLTANAPSGGAVVSLYSGTTSAATVPASVTVASGRKTATFTVTTTSVASSTSVYIDAFYNSTAAQASLAVVSSGLAIGLNPTSVVGTNSSTGTITLGSPAPTGGATVTLSSSNTAAATVPPNVTVPAGSKTATFTVSTNAVATTTTSSIKATYTSLQASATLTVNPPDVSSVTLNPTSVTGGTPSSGTVTLDSPAPTGGALVTLSSDTPSAASVPTSVTVLAGATTATFTVTSNPVLAITTATISGSYNGTLASAMITVNPPSVSSLSLNPTTVIGGLTNSTGTVTLNAPAPTGGLAVSLSSSKAAVSVPANVTVLAGATTATFTATSNPVNVGTGLMITATLNGTATAVLTVNPPSVTSLTLNPTTVTGGLNNSTGTVILNTAAPTGGISVSLSSDTPAAASVPSNVTVLAGATTANFTVTTSVVNVATTPMITATFVDSNGTRDGTATATLTVNPNRISSLTLNPTSVLGGQGNSTGTITLVLPAPAAGVTVALASSNASAMVPATVAVAAGASTATFTITTISVSASTAVTITGTYNGTATANLTVNPPGISSISLNPTSVTGGVSSTGTVTLNGQAPAGGATVALSSNNGAATVPANVVVPQGSASATFTVTSSPVSSVTSPIITASYNGTQTAALTVTPPVLTAMNLNPSGVTGGVNSSGTVTLSGPAPAGGVRVTLSSDNTAAATVPSNVTVAAGQTTSASFTISTSVVSVAALANISGTFGGTKSAALSVYPYLSLASISITPTVTTGGVQLNGTVTLTNPAPAGGAVVSLSGTNNNAASTDPSVTVPAGATSAMFTVSTNIVGSAAPVTFTGSYNGVQSTQLIVNPPGVSTVTVFPSFIVPDAGDNNVPTNPGEYGVEFYSQVDGYAVGIQFYKSTLNTGVHVGNLWSASGQLLATATFTSETASGWQQVYFSSPVHLTANTTYVASYYNPTGNYSATAFYYAFGAGIDSAPLEVPGDTPSTPNGVYSFATTPSFPNATNNSSNYWVDVIFDPTPTNLAITSTSIPDGFQTAYYSNSLTASGGTQPYKWSVTSGSLPPGLTLAPNGLISGVVTGAGYFNFSVRLTDSAVSPQSMTESLALYVAPSDSCPCTIFPNSVSPAHSDSSQNTPGEFGVRFYAQVDGFVSGIRFYKESQNTGTHVGNLWSTSGQLLGTVTFANETASGWQEADFSSPIHVTTNTEYIASYYTPTGNFSGAANYFAAGAGIDSAPLQAPSDIPGAPNGVYAYGSTSTFPSSTTSSTNYWADLVFNAVPGATITSLTINPASVTGGITSTGTITLSGPASFGGQTVNLSSDFPEVASVPNSVTVPQGSTSADFPITTYPVQGNGSLQITATGNGVQSASLGIVTPSLQSVAVIPSTINAGYAATGTVTLDGPAPVGGWLIALSSNNVAATVPASITIPAGSTSTTFGISTSSVAVNTPVTISAIADTTQTTTLTVNAFTLGAASVSLNPATVIGGSSSTGTVLLNGPAPFGGTVVTLSSSDPSTTVPASVTVSAGASSATFTATTSTVSTSTQATISATAGVTRTAVLTVNPPTVLSISLNPTTVVGGAANSTGTVTLNGTAPAGGIAVTLSSSKTSAATVPATVTVSAGASTANFTATSVPVASAQTTSITANLNGSQSATLTVNPPSPVSVTFNPTSVTGATSTTGTLMLSGPAPAGGLAVSLSSNNAAATVTSPVMVLAGFSTANFTVTTKAVTSVTTPTITATSNGVATGQFTINPPSVSAVSLNPTAVTGGSINSTGTVTLNGAAPTGGIAVTLKSSNSSAATVGASVTVAAGATTANFTVTSVTVTSQATASITATLNGSASATLTVNPVATTVSSFTLNPTSTIGGVSGTNSTGTITLNSTAPAAGTVVTLSSSNTSVATVPANVTVAANTNTATFTVTPLAVGVSTNVTVTATFGGAHTAVLTVVPASVISVTMNPTSVEGGVANSTGTVTLNGPAAGTTTQRRVTLSDSSTAASVPASVTVATGATTATFTATSSKVAATTTDTITATASNGSSANAILTITPPVIASITLNPTSVKGGSANSTATVTLDTTAPTGGITVSLASDNTAAATVPSTATINSGSSTTTFTVTSHTVAASTTANISATFNGGTKSAPLTVHP